eukprot:GAHX01003733.1.p1 GENE.GAHX01003733.1~~GAHX01003733.1.p1  ORF type:complete len:63 (+),score=2.05 GAHX01003733.1:707-895(+)
MILPHNLSWFLRRSFLRFISISSYVKIRTQLLHSTYGDHCLNKPESTQHEDATTQVHGFLAE